METLPWLKEYGVCIPDGYDIHGIDISHYQGKIDWKKLLQNKETATPLHFVFMKATEGGDHNDTTFEANFANARNHGFIRGAYHFYIPSTDALKQADFFIRTVKLVSGDLPPVLDVEVTGRKEKKELQQGIKRWLDRVESHYGVKPIYTLPINLKPVTWTILCSMHTLIGLPIIMWTLCGIRGNGTFGNIRM